MAGKSDQQESDSRWQRFWHRPGSKWLLGIPVGACFMFVFGVISMIGFELVLYKTGTEEFCATACHTMKTFTVWRKKGRNNLLKLLNKRYRIFKPNRPVLFRA